MANETSNDGRDKSSATDPSATDKSLTVLQVLPSLVSGGVERGTCDMAAALVADGHRALVASSGGHLVHEIEREGGAHFTLPLKSKRPWIIWRNVARLADLIVREGVDIVHARSRAPAWSAYLAARRTGRPFVTTVHGPYSGRNALKRAYNNVMYRGVRVIATSHFMSDYIRGFVPDIEAERLVVIPRGVDMAQFRPEMVSAARKIQLADAWQVPANAPVLLMPGRLSRRKGQKTLIEAMARTASNDSVAVFAGNNAGHEAYVLELRALARHLGVEQRIRFVGNCRDMPAAYSLASAVVSTPSEPESFGRVAVEAQAMGRPVVVSAIGGSRETVIPGETGWWIEPDDAEGLTAAIDEMLALDDAGRAELAERGLAHVAQNFTKTLMCARTIAIYRELAG